MGTGLNSGVSSFVNSGLDVDNGSWWRIGWKEEGTMDHVMAGLASATASAATYSKTGQNPSKNTKGETTYDKYNYDGDFSQEGYNNKLLYNTINSGMMSLYNMAAHDLSWEDASKQNGFYSGMLYDHKDIGGRLGKFVASGFDPDFDRKKPASQGSENDNPDRDAESLVGALWQGLKQIGDDFTGAMESISNGLGGHGFRSDREIQMASLRASQVEYILNEANSIKDDFYNDVKSVTESRKKNLYANIEAAGLSDEFGDIMNQLDSQIMTMRRADQMAKAMKAEETKGRLMAGNAYGLSDELYASTVNSKIEGDFKYNRIGEIQMASMFPTGLVSDLFDYISTEQPPITNSEDVKKELNNINKQYHEFNGVNDFDDIPYLFLNSMRSGIDGLTGSLIPYHDKVKGALSNSVGTIDGVMRSDEVGNFRNFMLQNYTGMDSSGNMYSTLDINNSDEFDPFKENMTSAFTNPYMKGMNPYFNYAGRIIKDGLVSPDNYMEAGVAGAYVMGAWIAAKKEVSTIAHIPVAKVGDETVKVKASYGWKDDTKEVKVSSKNDSLSTDFQYSNYEDNDDEAVKKSELNIKLESRVESVRTNFNYTETEYKNGLEGYTAGAGVNWSYNGISLGFDVSKFETFDITEKQKSEFSLDEEPAYKYTERNGYSTTYTAGYNGSYGNFYYGVNASYTNYFLDKKKNKKDFSWSASGNYKFDWKK